jgi:hypothetical protein
MTAALAICTTTDRLQLALHAPVQRFPRLIVIAHLTNPGARFAYRRLPSHLARTFPMLKSFVASAVFVCASQTIHAQESQPGSNAEQGQMTGFADVVRSAGMAQLLKGQAVVQGQATHKLQIENRGKAVQGYLYLRQQSKEFRDAQRSSPLSTEQYVRSAREQAPYQLSAIQLDPLTGQIQWPLPLSKTEYEPFRGRLNRLFEERAAGLSVSGEVRATIEPFLARLKSDMEMTSANDYMQSRRFLESLQDAGRGVDN